MLQINNIDHLFVFKRLSSFIICVLLLAQQCVSETDTELFKKNIHLQNNLTRFGVSNDYTKSDSYRNIFITSLRALVISPDMQNRFGRISYRMKTEKGMVGIRLEYEEMKFNPPSFDGTCYPSFFMIIKDDIASSTYCGDFSSNQQDIMAHEGTELELLIVNQAPYINKEPAKWRILISQIPKINIEAEPLMETEKENCGMKKDSPPDESNRIMLPNLPLKLPMEQVTWIEEDFHIPECRLGKAGCRAMRNTLEKYQSKNYFNKIVNGREAKTWPWVVALGTLKDGKFRIFCGGSIIGRRHIATACHCVQFSKHGIELKDVAVAVRVHDLSKKDEFQREYFSISKIMPNPEYHGVRNDFALLELSRPLNYDDKCSSICLPWKTDDQLEGSRVVITGWGLTSTYGSPSATLQEASVRCIPNANCSANWISVSGKELQGLIEPSMVCCGGNSATCNGDSGSPVHIQGTNGRWTLAGLVSFGPDYNCLDSRYVLSVHSRTTYFMKWIALSLAKPVSADIVTYN